MISRPEWVPNVPVAEVEESATPTDRGLSDPCPSVLDMDGTWSTEDAVAVLGPVVAAGLTPSPDDGFGDDLHREVLLRCLAPQLGAAADAGKLDPCRVEAYVRASVGHCAAVIAAGVASTLADAPLLPVPVLDEALPEVFEELARAEDAGLLVPADVAMTPVVGTPGVGASGAEPEAPAVSPEIGADGREDAALSGARAVSPFPASHGRPGHRSGSGMGGGAPPGARGRSAGTAARRAAGCARRPYGRAPPVDAGHGHLAGRSRLPGHARGLAVRDS